MHTCLFYWAEQVNRVVVRVFKEILLTRLLRLGLTSLTILITLVTDVFMILGAISCILEDRVVGLKACVTNLGADLVLRSSI